MLGTASTAWRSRVWASDPAPGSDPYWSDVVMLINAADGTVADRSTVNSAVSIRQSPGGVASTTQTLFRDHSVYNQTQSRYQVAAAAARQCPGEYTLEWWLWSDAVASFFNCPMCPASTSSDAGWTNASCGSGKSGRMSFEFTQSYTNYYVSAASVHNSTWHHVAQVRGSDNVIRFYFNGVQAAASRSSSATMDFGDYDWIIGGYLNDSGDNQWIGYMDDIRLTKGVARYTSTFTPPTAAFPMS